MDGLAGSSIDHQFITGVRLLRCRRALVHGAGIFTLIAVPLGAQPAGRVEASGPLTVSRAVALARAHHPALAAASARGQVAVGTARQQAAFPNPMLEWRQENLASPLAPDAFFTVVQPLDLSGRRIALRAAVADVRTQSASDSLTALRSVEAEAARAFWRAALAQSLADVAAMQRTDAERLADIEATRAREGAVAELSAMRAGLEADRARFAEATSRAEVARASADLARATGVPIAALPPVLALTTSLPPTLPLPEPAIAIAAAVTRRSDLASRRAGVSAARLHLSASRRAMLPDVELQAGTKQTAGYATRTFGVAIPLPLLDRNAGARESAIGAVRLAEAELRAAELATSAEVTAAIDALRALSDARTPAADSLAARAAEVARVADAAYAAGGGSLLELLDARRARADALTAALALDRRAAARPAGAQPKQRSSAAPGSGDTVNTIPFSESAPPRRFALLAVLIVALLAAAACGGAASGDAPAAAPASVMRDTISLSPEATRLAGLVLASADSLPWRDSWSVPGRLVLDPAETQALGAIAEGRVTRVFVRVGDVVHPGQVMVAIHSHEMLDAQSGLASALAREAESASALQTGQNAATRAERLYDIRSPIAGVVMTSSAQPGAVVLVGTPLVTVSRTTTLVLSLRVPENALRSAAVGVQVEFAVAALPGERFRARVARVAPALDSLTRTLEVQAPVLNGTGRLRAEMYATAELLAPAGAPTLVVPSAAVQALEGDTVVVTGHPRDGGLLLEAVRIRVGRRTATHAEILAGLVAGTPVVAEGAAIAKAELLRRRAGE